MRCTLSSLPDTVRLRFTADAVARMVEAGILGEDDPIELIDGDLITMVPQGPEHRGLTVVVRDLLIRAFGAGFHVQDHSPIAAGPNSLPEPDLAVIRGRAADLLQRHPTGADVALVVEISVTSQATDRAKAEVYARADVPEYWNLDVPARKLTVYRAPRPDLGEYTVIHLLHATDTVPAGETTLCVADLLP